LYFNFLSTGSIGLLSMKRKFFSTTPDVPCRFCRFFSDNTKKNGINVPWLANDHYAALVSVGALVPGWSLVCPIEHQLNLSQQYRKGEFWRFVTTVTDAICQQYGEVRLFEHGAFSQDSTTGCGTGHAHLHIVPLEFSLIAETLLCDPNILWQSCFASEILDISNGREYLFMADNYNADMSKGLVTILDSGISQFFRRVIANRLGLSEFFDYQHYPMLEMAEASAEELRNNLLKMQKKVSNF